MTMTASVTPRVLRPQECQLRDKGQQLGHRSTMDPDSYVARQCTSHAEPVEQTENAASPKPTPARLWAESAGSALQARGHCTHPSPGMHSPGTHSPPYSGNQRREGEESLSWL